MITPRRLKRIQDVAYSRHSGLVVVLEDIHDPHNAAAVFRTCDALGIQTVYLIYEQEKYTNPRRVGRKTSSSASKWLDLKVFRSTKACLRSLRRAGYTIVATDLSSASKPIFRVRFNEQKIALLIGNEHRGLSAQALSGADRSVTIPMLGMVQSLNLSVTAAIVLYEIVRQRLGSRKKFSLSTKAKRDLTLKLLRIGRK